MNWPQKLGTPTLKQDKTYEKGILKSFLPLIEIRTLGENSSRQKNRVWLEWRRALQRTMLALKNKSRACSVNTLFNNVSHKISRMCHVCKELWFDTTTTGSSCSKRETESRQTNWGAVGEEGGTPGPAPGRRGTCSRSWSFGYFLFFSASES